MGLGPLGNNWKGCSGPACSFLNEKLENKYSKKLFDAKFNKLNKFSNTKCFIIYTKM